ncbi:ABC transporter ATP-binding protein/permease [Frondihabitans cladoniiphilus]|uniref:MacB family efflux pump subunit n=1 Tax=Frondihabitans cladoniiphilus TaxID=715785 RepID=A0ABP8W4Y7_9MICO
MIDEPSPRPPGAGHPLLEIRDLGRVYGSGPTATTALASVNLTVMPGELVAIVGPSGSGKSTLLNILGLLDSPTAGLHRFAGVDVSDLSERERNALRSEKVGFVFQDSHVLLDDSAAVNVSLGLKIQGIPRPERRTRVGAALADLGMTGRADEKAQNLSGGERQRVAIARAMATDPSLLLADEPTGALDTENTARIIDHLLAVNRAGTTVLVITHDETVAAAATRVVRLINGVLDDGVRAPGSAEHDAPEKTTDSSNSRLHGWPRLLPGLRRRLTDEALDAISSHSGRPGRTVLLLTAFLLGAGGLVCSLGVSQSAAVQVSERLTRAGLDEVVVRAGDQAAAIRTGFYDRADSTSPIASIEHLDGVREVGFVAAVPSSNAPLTLLDPTTVPAQQIFAGPVRVADAEYLRVQGATVRPSHGVGLLDNTWGGRVAVLGRSAAHELGIAAARTGAAVWIGGERVDVVGILDDTGRDPLLDRSVILSPTVASSLTIDDPQLVVRTEPGFPAPLAAAIPLAVSIDQPESVKVETVADLRSLHTGVVSDLGTLIGISSWILLALATLSAATAMYLSVQARAREVALRRAIGASRLSIWRLFTCEGLMIGAAGGLAGSTLGLCGVLAVCAVQAWTPVLDPGVLVGGIVAGCATGVLSAAYPALIAARLDPATAFRR